MDNIYIDTSIFEANNFLESKRINEILKLAEESKIQIVLPAITYNETRNRAIKHIKESISRFKKYRTENRVLRNILPFKDKFDLPDEQDCIKEFLETFEKRLKKSHCIITDYPTINIKDIFDKYFGDEFPFSRGEKKHEFPDAFALLSVEKWCIENKAKCYVFSTDKDLLNYKSEFLEIIPSYEAYLDEKLRQFEFEGIIAFVSKLYETEKNNLEAEITEWITFHFNDFAILYSSLDQDVHGIDIEYINVDIYDFQIVSTSKLEIIMETKCEISYKVEAEIDDEDTGYYDSEDKVIRYLETEIKVFEGRQIIPIQLKASIPLAGYKYMNIEIDEINSGRELKI